MYAAIDDAVFASEVYRFTSTPQLDVLGEVRVTVFHNESGASLVTQRLFEDFVRRELPPDEWDRLHRAIERSGFWSSPQWPSDKCLDGVHWEIKGRKGEKYSKVSCFNPLPGPLTDLGQLFLELAGN